MVNNNVNNFNPILLQATSTFPPPDLSSSSGLYSDQQSSNTNTFYSPSQHHNHATPTTASSSRLTAEQMMSSSSSSASITQKSQGCSCPCSQRSASSLMSSSSLHRIKDLKVGLHHKESIERKKHDSFIDIHVSNSRKFSQCEQCEQSEQFEQLEQFEESQDSCKDFFLHFFPVILHRLILERLIRNIPLVIRCQLRITAKD